MSFLDKAKETFEHAKDVVADKVADAKETVGETVDKVQDAAANAKDVLADKVADAKDADVDGPIHVHTQYRLIVESPAIGVLKQMGYAVGRNGLAEGPRRVILRQVIEEVELVAASPESIDYVQEWGTPRSWQRLDKTDRTLAAFIRLARRREQRTSADMSGAIADWEHDLDWLRNTYGQ